MTLDDSPLMDSFDDMWPQLVGFARANDRGVTLSQESENELWYDADEEQLVVRSVGPNTEGTAHELSYDNLKRVWDTLQVDGELRRENTREALGRHRGSVTMAIFQQALDLPYEENPLRVTR